IPFLALAISQKAHSHLSRAIGESSSTVPTFTENCCFSCADLHFQMRRVAKKETSSEPQRGHFTTPSGQRIDFIKSNARSSSAKYLIASCSVSGNATFFVFIPTIYQNEVVSQV